MNWKLTHFFDKSEFNRQNRNWYSRYDPRWLVLIDTFRLLTGKCILSPHIRALGRNDGVNNRDGFDGHNIDKHGLVMAGDCYPFLLPDASEYLSAHRAFHTAKKIGFTGIGIYPQWTLHGTRRFGLHLDTRRHVTPGDPVTWGYLDGDFTTIEKAFEFLINTTGKV